MAKCTILTVQRSYNYGSFLQSFALSSALKSGFGIRPAFAEFGARSIPRQCAKRIAGHCKRGKFGVVPFELGKMRALDSELSYLAECPLKTEYSSNNLLLFGSDEIWNISRPEFASFPQFWGKGIAGGRRATYAVSANGALDGNVSLPVGFEEAVRSFDMLSARDASTKQALEAIADRKVELVCDPTLLLDSSFYRSVQDDQGISDGYILVYSYGLRIPKASIEAIKSYAHAEGLLLVSAGFWLEWCDICLPVSAFGFLGLMDSARAVVTDTFHGTVFSTIYRKRFLSFSGGAEKVRDYLAFGGLSDRDGSEADPVAVLRLEPDFEAFERAIAALADSSYRYLAKCLSMCEEGSLG